MKNVFYIVTVIFLTVIGLTVNAKPRCQGFNNYDNKVTIVFTEQSAGIWVGRRNRRTA